MPMPGYAKKRIEVTQSDLKSVITKVVTMNRVAKQVIALKKHRDEAKKEELKLLPSGPSESLAAPVVTAQRVNGQILSKFKAMAIEDRP